MRFPSGVIASCKDQRLTTSKADGKSKRGEEIMLAENNQFAEDMDHFSDCVMNNKKPSSPGEEGLQNHIIMEAIYQSAKEGKDRLKSAVLFLLITGKDRRWNPCKVVNNSRWAI